MVPKRMSSQNQLHKELNKLQGKISRLINFYCSDLLILIYNTLQNADGSPMPASLSMDGEAMQLGAGMEHEVYDQFVAHNIHFAKGPPSATSIHQASDHAVTFKKFEKGLEKMNKQATAKTNAYLKWQLEDAFGAVKRHYNSRNIDLDITNDHRNKIIQGLINIIFLAKNGNLNESDIQDGFRVTRQHRDIADDPTPEQANTDDTEGK